MQEAAAVLLLAVREMQQEFIQSQAAMTPQSLAVQQKALSEQEESLRVQQYIIAQLASSADADPMRKLREKDQQFPAFTVRLLERETRKEQRNLPDAVAIQYAFIAIGDTLLGIFLWDRPSQIGMSS